MSNSWCRRVECGLEWWEGSRGKKGVVGGQALRDFSEHPTWSLQWRSMTDSQLPAVFRASGQEISTNICSILLSFIWLILYRKIFCRIFEENFCSSINFQGPQELELCHINIYNPNASHSACTQYAWWKIAKKVVRQMDGWWMKQGWIDGWMDGLTSDWIN